MPHHSPLFAILLAITIPTLGSNGTSTLPPDPAALIIGADQITKLLESQSSIGVAEGNNATLANTTDFVMNASEFVINEVKLNPSGNDTGIEWIELYNGGEFDFNVTDVVINTSKFVIELPQNIVVEAGETYVLMFEMPMLSNVGEMLMLTNATNGYIIDRTPSLFDRNDDSYTWQRVPDGKNEWQFTQETSDELNDPSTSTEADSAGTLDIEATTCFGTAGCAEGLVVRIVDGDTLYVRIDSSIYKVDLALAQAPLQGEEGFIESTAFTRTLCLGSPVIIDQDDGQLALGSIVAVVHCSSANLNKELLEDGYADLNIDQCSASEFATHRWAVDHGC